MPPARQVGGVAATAGSGETAGDGLGYTTKWECCPAFPVGMSGSEALCLKVCFNPCTCW